MNSVFSTYMLLAVSGIYILNFLTYRKKYGDFGRGKMRFILFVIVFIISLYAAARRIPISQVQSDIKELLN